MCIPISIKVMTALMTAPMAIIEIILMRTMYENERLNIAVVGISALGLAGSFWFIRTQAAIGDTAFLRSMIPHHSVAILMCREATITDTEIKKLCGTIIASQQREIDQMKPLLAR